MALKKQHILAVIFFAALLFFANCKNTAIEPPEPEPSLPSLPSGATKIAATPQRIDGDAQRGYNYLVTGNYISSGVPLDIYKQFFGTNPDDLNRTGDNKGVAHNFNVVSRNGFKMVASTCLTCHAERLDGKIVVGMGNVTADNTIDVGQLTGFVDLAVQARYPKGSAEWAAYEPFSRATTVLAPSIRTETRGVNNADKIFAVLAAYRKKEDLTWLNTPQYEVPKTVVPTDVPAWWIVRKKNALYYNALGVGDMAKHLMSASLLTLKDSAEARSIEANAADLWACIRSVKPPKYPNAIDQSLVQRGKLLFNANCAKCHGKHETDSDYPNLLLSVESVGTDKALADLYATFPDYHNWFNASWLSKKAPQSLLTPTRGYIAPPLDGIWATAPYLHNGSVPTLDDLLKSNQRPTFFSRNFDNGYDFDAVKVGWKYKVENARKDSKTYDTTLAGYGNGGHIYGDKFSDDERKAVIEFLKTL